MEILNSPYLIFAGGICLGIILSFIVVKIRTNRKKKYNLPLIREMIEEGYEGLKKAADSFHKFNDVINEVSANAK
jgi:hypothetical protein